MTKYFFNKLAVLNILLMFLSCGEKTNFTSQELLWLNVYNVGDEITFRKAESSVEKTIMIIDKKIYHKSYNPISSELKAHIGELYYKIKGEAYEAKLIEMYKKPDEIATPIIDLFGSSFLTESNQLNKEIVHLSLSEKSFEDAYVFNKEKNTNYSEERHGKWPQTIYWDKEYGIVKYITYDGEVWERINW